MELQPFLDSTRTSQDVFVGTLNDTAIPSNATFPCGTGLGDLACFPTEILHLIFADVDLDSLEKCRSVNRTLREIIDSMYEYGEIVRYIPRVFEAASAIGTAKYLSCRKLHQLLFDRQCTGYDHVIEEPCPDAAEFICFLTGSRRCLSCMGQEFSRLPNPQRVIGEVYGWDSWGTPLVFYLSTPLTAQELADIYGLKREHRATIPSFVIQGRYSPAAVERPDSLRFYDPLAAYRKALQLYKTHNNVEVKQNARTLTDFVAGRFLFAGKKANPASIPLWRCLWRLDSYPLVGSNRQIRARRFMSSIRAPCLDSRNKITELSRYCARCIQTTEFIIWFPLTLSNAWEHWSKTSPRNIRNEENECERFQKSKTDRPNFLGRNYDWSY